MGKSLVMEGADGAAKIAALSASYSANPPAELDGVPVSGIRDFSKGDMVDVEGRSHPRGKDDLCGPGGRPQLCGAPLRHGTQDQILPLRPREAGRAVKEALPKVQASLDSLWAAVEKDARTPFRQLNIVNKFAPATTQCGRGEFIFLPKKADLSSL